jgi:ParB family chromosome partitioning protein
LKGNDVPKDIRSFIAFSDIDPGDNISDSAMRRITDGLEEFARSIDINGLLNPMTVQEGGPSKVDGKRRVKLRVGFRRYFAIKMLREGALKGQKTSTASWAQVEVKFIKGNDRENDAKNLVENLHRKDLDPLEEALAMQSYMQKHECSQAQLARDIAKSEPYVSQRLSLLRSASEEVRAAMRDGVITPTHARELAALSKPKQDEMVADLRKRIAAGEKIAVIDVRDEVQAKVPRSERKKGGRKSNSFDEEKIAIAREAYTKKKFVPKPRQALLEGLGTLVTRSSRSPSDATTQKTHALEWALGLRDSL